MISVFQIFKIILGIIISAFILFMILRFSSSYMEIGESSRQVSIMVSFKKAIDDVYTTGISTDFEMKDAKIVSYRPPYIDTGVSFVDAGPVPLLLAPGGKFSVYRNEYDLGWWKFHFIEILPETNVLFTPLGNDEKVWSTTGNIAQSLPSTENLKTKFKFFIGCNKTNLKEYWNLGERNRFLDYWLPLFARYNLEMRLEMGTCDDLGKNFRNITVSGDETDADFLVKPTGNETGHVYIKKGNESEEFIYKNGLDVVALFLGGKTYYDYLNEKFKRELEIAVDVWIRESGLLTGDTDIWRRCGTEFSNFRETLNSIKEMIPKINSSMEDSDAMEFDYYIKESVKRYKELDGLGCS